MIKKKLLCGFFALALLLTGVLTTFTGCSSSSSPEVIKIVPAKADFIAEIQLDKLLNDQDLIDAYDSNEDKGVDQPQTIDEALDEVSQKTGLNLRDFSRVLIFGDLQNMTGITDSAYVGIIVQGTVKETEFIQNIENKTGNQMTTSTYKGYTLYSNDADKYTIAFFGSEMFVFGESPVVKDTIDVKKGDQSAISGLVLETYNRLGAASITCALSLPLSARQALENGNSSSSPISTEVFSAMDVVGFSFNKSSDNVAIKINMHFTDAQAVTNAKDTISGLFTMLKGVMQVNEVKDLLDKIQVTVSGVWLNVSLNTTLSELQNLSQIMPTE